MDELLAMQQSALQVNLNKASNIQKAVTLTEANWMGLTRAMELTGSSILKAQETLERLPTTQEMNTLLAGQAGNLTAAHTEAVQQIRQTVQELLETGRENLRWMQETMQESEKLLKEFQSQAGKISETYSSRLSSAEDTLRESAKSIGRKMYAPSTLASYRRMLEVVFPYIGAISLCRLRPIHMENLLAELRKRTCHGKPIREATTQKYLTVVSAVLSDAKRNEILEQPGDLSLR